MTDGFAELHDELRAVARDLLGSVGQDAAVDWALAANAGWLGLEVPESLDGSGATFAEVAVVLHEMGRAASRSPYLGSVVLGVGALAMLDPGPRRDDLLRAAAAGAVVPVLALAADDGPPFRVERAAAGLSVEGQAAFVVDATRADGLLLPAIDAEGQAVVVEVDPAVEGLTVEAQPVVDATRRLGVVTADGVTVGADAVLGSVAIDRLRDRAAVAVACDSLGLGEAMLDATVAYAGVREQFGRPIGSFQAVKHACADMLVQLSVARELVAAAIAAVAAGDPAASVAVSMAKSYACGAAVDVVGQAMQLHGGIGYTWESGVHVYLKRAALNRSLYGSPAAHRRRLAARYA